MPASASTATSRSPPSLDSSSSAPSSAIPSDTSDCGVGMSDERLLEHVASLDQKVVLAHALRVVAGVCLVAGDVEQLERRYGRSALTEIRLRRPPRYSQKARQALSWTTSRSTRSPSGSSATPRAHARASSISAPTDGPDAVRRHLE